jgi:bacillithiol biosynthesis deacetylase BshB1
MSECIMIIATHPDDAEIGMGGTIISLSRKGYDVIIVDLTDGEPTPKGSPEIRASESQRVDAILKIHKRINLGLINRELFDTVENRKKLATVIRQYRPKVIFMPFHSDAHPDHIQACQLSEAACFYSKFVKSDMEYDPHTPQKKFHYYANHLNDIVSPSFVFDISDTFELKYQALQEYESQLNSQSLKKILTLNSYWGQKINTNYGEPFSSKEVIGVYSTEWILDA